MRRTDRGVEERQRGSVAIMTALMLVMLVGFAALVIDVGLMFRVRSELQNASDSAALAGAQRIDGTADGITAAQNEVKQFAKMHLANNSLVSIEDEDILFGRWHFKNPDKDLPGCTDGRTTAPCFESFGTAPADPSLVNAVQVTSRRTADTGNAVQFFFATLLGRSQTDITGDAIAIGGGPAAECAFPIVVPDCVIPATMPNPPRRYCDYCMKMANDKCDNAGWTSFAGSLGNAEIDTAVRSACFVDGRVSVDPVTGECNAGCGGSATDDSIPVKNGIAANKNDFCGTIMQILLRNGTPAQSFTVRVPVLKSEPGECASAPDPKCPSSTFSFKFSGDRVIAGFATLEIFGIYCDGNNSAVDPSAPVACTPTPSVDAVVAGLRCDLGSAHSAGGGNFGTRAPHVMLVK